MKTPLMAGVALLACVTALTGCDAQPSTDAVTGTVGTEMSSAIEKARRKLDTGNITVSNSGPGKAEITPTGDLLIDGRTVPVSPQQRALLLDYRTKVAEVAGAGMDIGTQGAGLAMKAMGEAMRGVFTGDTEGIEQRVESQADGIREAARKLCDRLPALHASQKQLAAALPEFAPYATMTTKDVTDCYQDVTDGDSNPPAPPTASIAPSPTAGAAPSDPVAGAE